MSDLKELKNLLTLLSAESEKVREAVQAELLTRGHLLQPLLDRYAQDLEPDMLYHLHELVAVHKSRQLRTSWLAWTSVRNEMTKLEMALGFLAQTLPGDIKFPALSPLLDEWVRDFLVVSKDPRIPDLVAYLFSSGRLKGAEDDYFNPLHSNLSFVLTSGRGLPISLATILMLMAARLGLEVHGFNMPGHFLARYQDEGRLVLLDCYKGGHVLTEGEMLALSVAPQIHYQILVDNPPTAADIVFRVLGNLANAYQRAGDMVHLSLTHDLLEDLRNHLEGRSQLSTVVPIYELGTLVKHAEHGYRAVVVAADPQCRADEAWLKANQPHPARNQPWYHLLVDASNVTTYVAHNKLLLDKGRAEIRHPLIGMYFRSFQNGVYVRNDRPWTMP